jgi:hypothetical protein
MIMNPKTSPSFFQRIWPVVGIVFGFMVTIAWCGLLGYGFFHAL